MIKIMTEVEAIEIMPQMANAISSNNVKIFYKDGAGPYVLNSSGHLFDKNGKPINGAESSTGVIKVLNTTKARLMLIVWGILRQDDTTSKVVHIDNNKRNDALDNLETTSQKEIINKIKKGKAVEIYKNGNLFASVASLKEAEGMTGERSANICTKLKRKRSGNIRKCEFSAFSYHYKKL